MKALLLLALIVSSAYADIYMQWLRGSNDRLNEENTNRNNANRLFNSQNNAKGGYCIGPMMYFYEGSFLSLTWTNQHGCGNPKLYCNVVIQWMCSSADAQLPDLVRDGTTTNTIPNDAQGPLTLDANGNPQFGMHEPRSNYVDCTRRNRNKGLWIADREEEGNLDNGRASSIFTRQENNGDRYGYECPEDKDYYPYWASTPWRDMAVLVEDTKFCPFYQTESQNVKSRGKCIDANGDQAAPNNDIECRQGQDLQWIEVPAHGIPAPDCLKAPWTRDNNLGTGGVETFANDLTYNTTFMTRDTHNLDCIYGAGCHCVVRIRYNISSTSMGPDSNNPDSGFIDYRSNAGASPVTDDPITSVAGFGLQLAIDTTQFFRTFQDRSHVFNIKPRPSGMSNLARIFNLNVKGKRGNIVQAYPAQEYDFWPTHLFIRVGDYIHFQWTGCDTNPAGNAGEGTDQTDRSNIVQIEREGASVPASDAWLASNTPLFETEELRRKFAFLDQTNCLTQAQLLAKNNNNANTAKQDVQNCMKLNAASPYFDGGLVRMNLTGTFQYISTRNNNFTNRDQRGVITVELLLPTWAIALVAIGGALCVGSVGVAGAVFYSKSHPHSAAAKFFRA